MGRGGGLQRRRERVEGVERAERAEGNGEEGSMVNKAVRKQGILSLPISVKSLSLLDPPPPSPSPHPPPPRRYLALSIAVGARQIPQPQSDRPSNDLARKPSIN